jgi:hypothetical protein
MDFFNSISAEPVLKGRNDARWSSGNCGKPRRGIQNAAKDWSGPFEINED